MSSTRRPAEDTHRIKSVISWSVDIVGFTGSVHTCVDCSPVLPIGCVKRTRWSYNDDAVRLAKPPFDTESTETARETPTESEQVGLGQWSA